MFKVTIGSEHKYLVAFSGNKGQAFITTSTDESKAMNFQDRQEANNFINAIIATDTVWESFSIIR